MIKKLLSNSVVYGLSGIIARFIGFILLPVYSKILSPSEYGILGLYNTTFFLLFVVLVLGLDNATFRFYFEDEYKDQQQILTANWFWAQIVFSLTLCIIVYFFRKVLTQLIFGANTDQNIIVALVTALALYCLPNIVEVWFRIKEKPWNAFSYAIILSVLNISTTYYFIVIAKMGVWGFIYGQLLAYAAGTVIALVILYQSLSPLFFNFSVLKKMFHYGFPFVPATALQLSVNWACNFFTNSYLGLHEAGVYNMANTFAMMLTLVTNSFAQAYLPFAYSINNKKESHSVYAKVLLLYSILMCLFVIGYGLFSGFLLQWFTPAQFYHARYSMVILALHYFLISLTSFTNFGAALAKKTKYYPVFVAAGLIVTCVLFIVFIPYLGITGTAMALVIGQLLIPFLTARYSQKVHFIAFPYKRVSVYIGSAILCLIAIFFLPDMKTAVGNFMLRVAVMLLFIGLAVWELKRTKLVKFKA